MTLRQPRRVSPPAARSGGPAPRRRVRIRRAVDADRALLRTLVRELHETVEVHDPYVRRAASMTRAYLDHLLAMTPASDGRIWIAEDDHDALGYLCLFGRLVDEEPDERPVPYAFVADLYVRTSVRGHGIGRALLQRAEAHARRLGVERIELRVFADNADARAFYRAVGYRDRIVTMVKLIQR